MKMKEAACFGITLLALALPAGAQPSAIHKETLQEQPFPAPIYHTVTIKTVVDHDGLVDLHTHPGVEMAYIAEGHATITLKGQAPLSLGAGQSFSVPADTVHSVRNDGPGALTIVSTYVVDKDKPIASPAK